MLGVFEGSPGEKLEQVAKVFADLAPQASCQLSVDGKLILCRAARPDGTPHVKTLKVDYLPTEIVRHAAMQLAKATHSPDSIGEWERWASAWHVIQVHGHGALAHVDERIAQLTDDGSAAGAELFRALRERVAVLQANAGSWPGQA